MAKKNTVNYNIKLDASITNAVKKTQKIVDDIEKDIKSINKTKIKPIVSSQTQSGLKKMGGLVDNLKGQLGNLMSSVGGAGNSIMSMTSALGPYGMAIGAVSVAVVGLGTNLMGIVEDIKKTRKEFEGFIKDSKELENTVSRARALQKVFKDIDKAQFGTAMNVIMKDFGKTAEEAFTILQKGLVATNGKLNLDDIQEFSDKLKMAGFNAQELVALTASQKTEGLFGNKLLDTIHQVGLSLREMTKTQEDALTGIGMNPKEVTKRIQDGVPLKEIIKDIQTKMGSASVKAQQTVMADIFKGAGEDLSERGLKLLQKTNFSLDEMIDKAGKGAKQNIKLLEANNKLTKAQSQATKHLRTIGNSATLVWTKLQTKFYEAVTPIMDEFHEIKLLLDKIFGDGSSIMGFIDHISDFKILGLIFKGISEAVKGLLIFTDAFLEGWGKFHTFLKDSVLDTFKKIKKVVELSLGAENIKLIGENFNKMINFVARKWTHLSNLIGNTIKGMLEGLRGNFSSSGSLFKEALSDFAKLNGLTDDSLRIGPPLPPSGNSSADSSSDSSGGNNVGNNGGGSNDLVKKIDDTFSNAVNGVSAGVKNITINLDSLITNGTQIINNSGDVEDLTFQLQRALLQVVNDSNSTVK